MLKYFLTKLEEEMKQISQYNLEDYQQPIPDYIE